MSLFRLQSMDIYIIFYCRRCVCIWAYFMCFVITTTNQTIISQDNAMCMLGTYEYDCLLFVIFRVGFSFLSSQRIN